jgi:hypothetical protein
MQTSDKISIGALLVSLVSIIVAVTTVMNKSAYAIDSITSALGDPKTPSGLYAQIDNVKRDALATAETAKKDSEIALLNSVPTGTILPWIPTDNMKNVPKGWNVCDGSNGTPDLEGRFLMGVRHLDKTQSKGGRSDIPGQGAHSHGGATTTVNSNRIAYDGGGDNNGVWFNHNHSIQEEGNHNHGGENRPPYFTVIYIIKTS